MKTRHQTSAYGLGQKNNLQRVLICAGLLTLSMSLCNKALAEVRYTLKDLGTLSSSGGGFSEGHGINNLGQVTGATTVAYGGYYAFVTTVDGQMLNLGSLEGQSIGTGINDKGEVTGFYADNYLYGYDRHSLAFVSREGKMIDLGSFGGFYTQGRGINSSGQVTGVSSTGYKGPVRAFLKNGSDSMIDLGTLGGINSAGTAINDSGQTTGTAQLSNGKYHAFITSGGANGGQMTDLGSLPGGDSGGEGINNNGQVTGWLSFGYSYRHAFVTNSSGQIQDLGTLGGYSSEGKGINSSGQIVGMSQGTSGYNFKAFVVIDGVMKDLNTLVVSNPGRWELKSAYGINDKGQIVANAVNPFGAEHAVLLTPVATSPISADPKNSGNSNPDCPQACAGNPINAATGNKFQAETDFIGAANTGLEIRRFYNSQSNVKTTLGFGWRGSWQQALTIDTANNSVKATREDGRVESFTQSATGTWQSDADVVNQLSVIKNASNQQTGWQLLTRDDAVESYTLDGRLNSITTRAGMTTSLSYDNQNRLSTVTGHFGHALSFAYNTSNQLSSISLPDGSSYQYAYDADNNLVSVTNPDQTKRQYVYENSTFTHLLTGIIDENGKRFATWTYDTQGRATSSQHAGGAELTSVAYNADGSATVTDALGNQHGYNFTTQFDVVKPSDVTGAANKGLGAKAFTYDTNGFVASKTDFNGNVTTFVRDAGGQETSRTEAAGTALARTISTTWHANFRLPIKITEPNRVTSFSYDANGNLLKRTITAGAISRSWAFTYNAAGQVLTVDGPRTDLNDISQYAYDNLGNLSSVTDALGHVTEFTAYNANGQPLSSKDANGLVKNLTYDARGRVTSIKSGDETTAYVYDAVGQVSKTIAPDGTAILFNYDDAHRLVKITDQLDNRLNYTLDAVGNRLKEEVYDPKSNLVQTLNQQFDSLNRLVAKIDSAGQKQAYTYDDNDNPLSATDPLGNATSLSYDALNRLIGSVDPDGNRLTTAYDVNDNLVSVTDPLTHATQYSYDGLGNALTIDSPDTGVSANKHDAAGNKIETSDARGEKVAYSYDALNRVKQIQYGNSQIISFTYDQGVNGIGHLTQMNDATGVMRWSYDKQGRISSKTFTSGSLTLVTRYSYDANGRLASITYPSGNVVQVTYQNGLVTALDTNSKSLISGVSYQPFGAPVEWTFGNGAKTTREFDLDGRLVAYDLGDRSRQLSYDAAGHITGYQDSDMNHDQGFVYDALSRLTGFTTPSTQIDYSYDANGNRTGKLSGSITDTSTLDAASNRLLKNSNPAKDYSYDAAGNLINDGYHQFTYDGRGRLIKASSLLGTEHYLLNGLGQRLAKLKSSPVDMTGDANQDGSLTATDLRLIVLMSKGSTPLNLAADCNHDSKITSADALCTQAKMADMRINPSKYAPVGTYFTYDDTGHLIGEYSQKGTPIQETVWLGDMPVAVMDSGSHYYLYADHLNAPKAIADEVGKTVWRWDSEAFGSTLANEDPDKDGKPFVYNLRFPGQYYDQLTGLHYNGFRDYDPKIGRYIESDPIGLAGGNNTYGYVEGNPVSKLDVKGLDVIVLSDSFHEVVGIETPNGLAIRNYGPSLAGGGVIHSFKAEEYVEVRRVPYSLQDGQQMLESLQSENTPLYTGLINCQTYAHSIANKAQYGARLFGIPYFGYWTPLPVDVPGMIQAVPRTFELGWREFKTIIKK